MFSIKGKLGHSLGFEWKTIRESSEDKWLRFQKCHCQKKKKNHTKMALSIGTSYNGFYFGVSEVSQFASAKRRSLYIQYSDSHARQDPFLHQRPGPRREKAQAAERLDGGGDVFTWGQCFFLLVLETGARHGYAAGRPGGLLGYRWWCYDFSKIGRLSLWGWLTATEVPD